jgi:nitrile hydratase
VSTGTSPVDQGGSSADRTAALEQMLLEQGVIADGDVDRIIDQFRHDVGPLLGARLVARAWTDDGFRERLLADADAVLDEMDIGPRRPDHLVVVADEPGVHNVVVCTLCSCYPWDLLGLPPAWYKDFSYRSRVVREPRRVLAEMGLELDSGTEVRVWDSSSEVRYMVLPERPDGTGDLAEADLVPLVDRDSMIGVARPRRP